MADENLMVELSMAELREITGDAVACAEPESRAMRLRPYAEDW